MNKRKIFLSVFVLLVVGIFLLNSSVIKNSSAQTSEFELKDGFEDYINNVIYTEYDNYTIEEYFQDYKNDQAHFTEDKEGFTLNSAPIDNGISNSYYEIIALGDWDGYITPLINLTEFPHIEFRIWMNVSTTRYQIVGRDYLNNVLFYGSYLSISADTWTIINYTISNEDLDDIRNFKMEFHPSHEVYPVLTRLDYVKIWKGNKTDYFFQEGDSVDFGEGDYDNFIDGSYFYNKVITAEETFQWNTEAGRSYGRQQIMNLDYDTSYYTDIKIRAKVNDTTDNPYFQFRKITPTTEYSQKYYITPVDTWVTITLSHNWISEIGEEFYMYCDSNAGTFTTFILWELDYVLLYHDDLTDNHIQIQQETSFYRASKGMRSFYKDLPLTFNYYEGYTASLNASIKINIPSIQFFPERCRFNYYSNIPFNFSFFIDSTEYLLFQNTNYLNDWFPIMENIDRSDYLLNTTEHSLYFELYTFKNTTEYIYIDELKVVYTDSEVKYKVTEFVVEPPTVPVKGFGRNITEQQSINYYSLEGKFGGAGSHVYQNTYIVGEQTEQDVFTRRIFYTKEFRSNDSRTYFTNTDWFYLEIDKNYTFRSIITVENVGLYRNITLDIWIRNDQSDLERWTYTEEVQEYILTNEFHFRQEITLVQEDYNTVSFSTIFYNTYYSNDTVSKTTKIYVNEGNNINNTFNLMSHENILIVYPYTPWDSIAPYNAVYFPSWFQWTSTKTFKHSSEHSADSGIDNPEQPQWNKKEPLKSIANILAYTIERIWEIAKGLLSIGTYLQDILKEIISAGKTMMSDLSSLVSSNVGILDNTGEGNNILSNILGGITNGFSNAVGKITDIFDLMDGSFLDFITGFFDNIISPFDNSREEGEGAFGFLGNWGDISEGFQDDNWGDVGSAWDNFFPSMTGNLIENTSNFWGGFANNMFEIPLTDIFDTIVTFWGNFTAWLTLLIIIYLIWMAQMLVRGDWDRMRQEITTIVNIVNWVVSGVVRLIHWIFELIWALLDVLIPFT